MEATRARGGFRLNRVRSRTVSGLAWLAFAVIVPTDQAAGQQAMPENEVVQEFVSRVQRGELNGVNIVHRVSGGIPGETNVREQMTIMGGARAEARRETTGMPAAKASTNVDATQIEELFNKLAHGVSELVPRDQARFLPDSAVGSITIEIGSQSTTLFYLADAEDRRDQEKPLSPETSEALEGLARLSRNLFEKNSRE